MKLSSISVGRSCRLGSAAVIALICLGATGLASADDPGAIVPRVAVFEFAEPDESSNRMVGRRAADATWLALHSEGVWELVESEWLRRTCEEAQASPPFGLGYLQMLGDRVRAALAIAGQVQVCELDVERGTAQVTLTAELIETLGGESLAAYRGVASSRREPGEMLDHALDRALTEAAANLARSFASFHPAAAIVLATLPDGRVMLDGPAEPAVQPGAKLLVYRASRAGTVVSGSLEVKTSQLSVLHAVQLSGEKPVQGDRAVVVAR